MCPQLIPSLRHVWHSRRAQHALGYHAFGLINRGSQGSTGMVGGRSAQADDAVTSGRQAKGHWLLRRRVVLRSWGRCQLPPSRQCATRSRLFNTKPPCLTRYRWGSPSSADYQRVEPLSRHLEGTPTPDGGTPCVGAASPRQPGGWPVTAWPRLLARSCYRRCYIGNL
jgi:hypothetical protein